MAPRQSKPKSRTTATRAKPKPKAKAPTRTKRQSGLNQITYSVSPELEEIVKAKKLTRPQIVKNLWAYIKANKCQDMKNKRMVIPDKKLSEVLGKKPIDMLKMAKALNAHIRK